jgi:hypothetical protein
MLWQNIINSVELWLHDAGVAVDTRMAGQNNGKSRNIHHTPVRPLLDGRAKKKTRF